MGITQIVCLIFLVGIFGLAALYVWLKYRRLPAEQKSEARRGFREGLRAAAWIFGAVIGGIILAGLVVGVAGGFN